VRERKIRAWDDVAKKMYYGEMEQYDDMLGFRFEHFETEKPIYMDWLGIIDKNGKDIYELDWVKFYGKFHGNKEDRILLAEYANRCAAYLFSDHPEDKAGWGLTFPKKDKYYDGDKAKFLEVAGNFFENKELLRKND